MKRIDVIKPAPGPSEISCRNEEVNKHHPLPKSRGGIFTLKRYKTFHDAFHRVFGNQTVDEQIRHILDIQAPVVKERFANDIIQVLQKYAIEDIYKEEAYSQTRKSVAKKK